MSKSSTKKNRALRATLERAKTQVSALEGLFLKFLERTRDGSYQELGGVAFILADISDDLAKCQAALES